MNEALVRSARDGDQQAFSKLVEEYYRPICGLAFSAVGNWQAAEDVAQDAFLVAWANLARLRTLDAFGAWLRRIARNLACNWIRSERYRRALLDRRDAFASEAGQSPPAAADNLARADALAETWAALEKLSLPLREAVVLYYLEENSIAQTAAVLGVTENSVKKRLQHARPQLRRYFEEQWKGEMERERRRIQSSKAGQRFMAGAALGPVSWLPVKLGTGLGLWAHGALHGEGTGRLASLLSFDSAVVRPATIGLIVVAASGAGLLWNANKQQAASENTPVSLEASAPTLNSTPVNAAPVVKPEEKDDRRENPVRQPETAAVIPAEKERPVRTVTVSGHVVDEAQHPVRGATVTVVSSGLEGVPNEPVVSFGGGGSVTVAGALQQEATGNGGSSGEGGFGGVSVGGGGFVGGSSGGGIGIASVPLAVLEHPNEDALNSALLDDARRFSTASASDGSFAIENVPDDGQLLISVDAPGYCLQGAIKAHMPTTGLTFTLAPGISTEGRLLGVDGRPISDALLQITELQWRRENGAEVMAGGWSATPQNWAWRRTDNQGRFTLKSEAPGYATVTVRSKTQGKATFQRVRLESGAVAELRFPKQSTVHGTLTLHNGTPAAGVIVLLGSHTGTVLGHDEYGETYSENAGPTYKATTDATGAYQITGLDPQMRYTASIMDKDTEPLVTGLDLPPLVAGQPLLWNFTLPLPIAVRGIATEQASGRPAVDCEIICKALNGPSEEVSLSGMPIACARTGPDGSFELRITTRSGDYAFGIQTAMGFQPLAQRSMRDGDSVVLDLVLPGGWSRSFLVLDASGNPLPGVSVQILNEGNNQRNIIYNSTGDDGRVRIANLIAGERVKFIFEYEGHEAESESLMGQEGMEFPEETIVLDLST